jgi:hypothetical protein
MAEQRQIPLTAVKMKKGRRPKILSEGNGVADATTTTNSSTGVDAVVIPDEPVVGISGFDVDRNAGHRSQLPEVLPSDSWRPYELCRNLHDQIIVPLRSLLDNVETTQKKPTKEDIQDTLKKVISTTEGLITKSHECFSDVAASAIASFSNSEKLGHGPLTQFGGGSGNAQTTSTTVKPSSRSLDITEPTPYQTRLRFYPHRIPPCPGDV